MRNTTIRKTGSAVLALVIGITSMVSPVTAQALTTTKTPTSCACSVAPILVQVLGGTQA